MSLSGCGFTVAVVSLSSALAFFNVLASAQGVKNPGPPLIDEDQEQVLSYWTAQGGWRSELQLRNNRPAQDLTVTPVLRAPDGSETPLPPVTIKPQEVRSVNLNIALNSFAPQLLGSYGSVVLRYRAYASRNLYAAIMIHDTGHPIAFHIDASGASSNYDGGSREGIWWLPNDTAKDILVLTNQGEHPLELALSIYDARGKEVRQQISLSARQTGIYSVREYVKSGHLTGNYGGIRVRALEYGGSLDTLHAVYDETAGFSALLKMFDHDPAAKIESRDFAHTSVWTLRAPMLALSNPDPALNFPADTVLQPQLFIRNAADRKIIAKVGFVWRNADTSATGKVNGPLLVLGPHETRRVDIGALQGDGSLPAAANWASVILTSDGSPDELVAVAASYDATLRYGAQTPFSDQLASTWVGGQWEADSMHDSLITAGNGGTEPTRANFTLFYNQGQNRYELEQTLRPDEQMWIDVGKLIRDQVPDKNGNTLPSDLESGSYRFFDLTNRAVGSLFEGKVIYDKSFGHVSYGCAACCATTNTYLTYNPFYTLMGPGFTNGVDINDDCGDVGLDVSSNFYNWSTANQAIATTTIFGTHTGISIGATTSSTHGYVVKTNGRSGCYQVNQIPNGPTNVVNVKVNSANLWNNQISVTLSSNPGLTGTLTIALVGSASTYSFQYGSSAVGAGSYTVTMNRPSIPADTYTSVKATWNVSSAGAYGTLGIKWKVLGTIRHSQYNTPYETSCIGAAANAWILNLSGCVFTPISLKSDFSSQVYINGTGVSNQHGIVKYTPGTKNNCSYPSGSDDSNTFLQVGSITGSCNKNLDTSSVATNPNPVTDITTFGCGDNLSLVTSSNAQQALKFPEDYCPACNTGFNGTNGHIDNYSTSTACSGHLVGDYGNFWTADTYASN